MRHLGFAAVLGLLLTAMPAFAAVPPLTQITADRVLGKDSAPVTIIEYASLTCSHCAHFAETVLPEIEKQAVETGKVKIIYRDFPLDGAALKAAALARCLPTAQYFPFIKMLFARQASWATEQKPEDKLAQLAGLAGLAPDTAKACMNDTKILDAIAAKRVEASDKYKVQATPTFIFNEGADRIEGAADASKFMEKINALGAAKK